MLVPFYLWALSSFGFWANPTAAVYPVSQIGVVKNVFAGKLECAGRLTDIEHVQTWCKKNGRVSWNEIVDLSSFTVSTIHYSDSKPGEVDVDITWLVAYVEGNPETVSYQIAYKIGGLEKPMISGQF